jgi:ribonucleotide reductase alpha subunit
MAERAVRRGVEEGSAQRPAAVGPGLVIRRHFTIPDRDPFDAVQWERRSAVIQDEKGKVVFEQHDVEIPAGWSQLATNVVVSKYFRGALSSPDREHSVRQMIGRVVRTIRGWGEAQGYFATPADAEAFGDELTHLLLHQQASFNSPVWFNVGIEPHPQCSACFILSVQDTMESILGWYRNEGIIFKGGSGSGVNLSQIRSSREPLAGGGTASGPVSFMMAADASAGVIKSGGKTRRAAKMVILNADHPDIVDLRALQGRGREEGLGIDRRRLRCLARRARLRLGLLPERQQLGARRRRLHARRARRQRLAHAQRARRRSIADDEGARPAAPDRRIDARLRRSGHAVRHHHQRLAHVSELGPHQRVQPVLRVHAPRRFGL